MALTILVLISATSFLWYGLQCLFNLQMRDEFERFGLSKYRIITGILQITGAVALYLGFLYPVLFLIGSAGLSLLMLLGVGVRLNIKDPWTVAIPAMVLMFLNAIIFFISL